MAFDELSHRRVSARMTSLVDLVDEAREDPLRLRLGVRTSRYSLAQVHAIFGDRVGAGVKRHPERAGRQGLDTAFGPLWLRLFLRHAGDHRTRSHHDPHHDVLRKTNPRGSEWPLTWGFGGAACRNRTDDL